MTSNVYAQAIRNQYITVLKSRTADRNNGILNNGAYYSMRLTHNFEGIKLIMVADSDIEYKDYLMLSNIMYDTELKMYDIDRA